MDASKIQSRILDMKALNEFMSASDELELLKRQREQLAQKIKDTEDLKKQHEAAFFEQNAGAVPDKFVFTYQRRNFLFSVWGNSSFSFDAITCFAGAEH